MPAPRFRRRRAIAAGSLAACAAVAVAAAPSTPILATPWSPDAGAVLGVSGESAGTNRDGPAARAPRRARPARPAADLPRQPTDGMGLAVKGVVRSGGRLRLVIDGGRPGVAPAIDVQNAKPGDAGAMALRVRNAGPAAAVLGLAAHEIVDAPGMLGGRLSERLELTVRDRATILFSGGLHALPDLRLGVLAPGQTRSWQVVLAFADGGPPAGPYTGDNRFQGAGVRAELALTARGR